MLYLVCYDIVGDYARQKVANLLQGYGLRVQKSVFECVLTEKQLETLQQKVSKFIKKKEDQIRFYPLSAQQRGKVIIVGMAPEFAVDDVVFIV